MDVLLSFIQGQCEKYHIDESHGLKHAKGTWVRASEIIGTLQEVKDEEKRVALYAAALHDMCDSKYCPEKEASEDIQEFLLGMKVSEEEVDAVLRIITTMSYSKLKNSMQDGKILYPEHGKWQRAYHIARNADLLEAYTVARCVLYNKHIYPQKTEDEHWERAEQLFQERVFRYAADGWINLPGALAMVPALEQEARRCLEKRLLDWPEVDM